MNRLVESNSNRAYVDAVMKRASYPNKTCLLLEGPKDVRVYYHLIDKDACFVVYTRGKKTLKRTVQKLDKHGFSGFIAIVDADYDPLTGKDNYGSPNIFLTDTHDLETMLLISPALEKYLSRFLHVDRIERTTDLAKNVRHHLILIGCPIGYLRWVCKDINEISLKDLTIGEYIHLDVLILDFSRLLNAVISEHCTRKNLTSHDLENKIDNIRHEDHDPWLVCNGHNLITIMSLILPKLLDGYSQIIPKLFEGDKIEGDLWNCYEYSFFQTTNLYQAIEKWELGNTGYRVLRKVS